MPEEDATKTLIVLMGHHVNNFLEEMLVSKDVTHLIDVREKDIIVKTSLRERSVSLIDR